MSSASLELRQITKRYGPVRALRGVDLRVGAGECVAVLGPNGAGKSTLLRIVAGLARPSSGEVLVDGRSTLADSNAWRRRLGHVSHHLMLHEALTTRENLAFAARLHGLQQARAAADRILRSLGLEGRADEPVRQLSRGLQQRAALARALLHDPEIVLLDEPYTGLDQASSAALTTLLRSLQRRGRLLLLVTHDVARAAETSSRVVHLRQGKVALDVPMEGIDAAGLERLLEGAAPPEAGAA